MGTSIEPWALDNERPSHQLELAPFWLDTTPVTNAAYAEFVADGGYSDPRQWSPAGWAWRQEAGLEHPQFWAGDGAGGWVGNRFGWIEELRARRPRPARVLVRSRRLRPLGRAEAADRGRMGVRRQLDARRAGKRRFPWGDEDPSPERATLWMGPSGFGPAPVTAHPAAPTHGACSA